MPSFADAVAQISAANVPVLFLDTCILLDVVRAPARGLAKVVESASELVIRATLAPPQCRLVVGSFVPDEWSAHESDVLGLLEKHLEAMDRQAAHFHGLCTHLGIMVSFGPPDYARSALAAKLHDLSRNLLALSLVLDRDPVAMARAYDRVAVSKRRPCRRGGELKDCQIFEECLEVGRQLRAVGFSRKLVFCTSNTEDYCAPGVIPHPDVAADCAGVDFVFTTSLPWALNELNT